MATLQHKSLQRFVYRLRILRILARERQGSSMAGRAAEAFSHMKEAMMEYAYLITLLAAVAVIAASAAYTHHVKAQGSVQAAAHAPEIRESAASSAQTPEPAPTALPTIAPLVIRPAVLVTQGREKPVSGAVLRGFSLDEPVYWPALSCIQAHAGTDLKGEQDEAVRCMADGVVARIVNDPLWGIRVRVDHEDGNTVDYAGLGYAEVCAGQRVYAGQTLGALAAEIPCEAELGAHLHLEMEREGVRLDPMSLLKAGGNSGLY